MVVSNGQAHRPAKPPAIYEKIGISSQKDKRRRISDMKNPKFKIRHLSRYVQILPNIPTNKQLTKPTKFAQTIIMPLDTD